MSTSSNRKSYHSEIEFVEQLNLGVDNQLIFHLNDGRVVNLGKIKTANLNKNYRSKSDVVLKTETKTYRISLKQKNADRWDSGDRTLRPIVGNLIKALDKKQMLCYSDKRLSKEVAISLPETLFERCVFGDCDYIFIIDHKNTQYFDCVGNSVYFRGTCLDRSTIFPETLKPIILFRNDRYRNTFSDYPGLRVEVATAKRLTKNTLFINGALCDTSTHIEPIYKIEDVNGVISMSNVNLSPQSLKVLNLLRSGKEISQAQAASKYGVQSLSKRISDIRKVGVVVKSRPKKDGSGVMYYI